MRTLSIFILAFVPVFTLAETANVKTGTSITSESGSTGRSSSNSETASTKTISLDISSGTLSSFVFRFGVDQLYPDYSRVLITSRNGISHALSQDADKPEYTIRPALEWNTPIAYLTFKATKVVTASPYQSKGVSLLASKDIYTLGAKIGGEISANNSKSPLSYFIDPDSFRSLPRATNIHERKLSIFYEQILSERLKGKVSGGYIARNDKPDHPETELSFAWAFLDDLALISNTGVAREFRSEAPQEDRGYLSAYWQDFELRYEINRKWMAKLQAGTILETESPRGTADQQRVGTDRVGIAVAGNFSRFEAILSGEGNFSNTGYRSITTKGEITWLF